MENKQTKIKNYSIDELYACYLIKELNFKPLKLQKTLWYIMLDKYISDKIKIFDDEIFEVWEYGPVIRKVYSNYLNYKEDIQKKSLDDKGKEYVKKIIEKYGIYKKNIFELSRETHKELEKFYGKNDEFFSKYKNHKIKYSDLDDIKLSDNE